jgi:hypothetical protein
MSMHAVETAAIRRTAARTDGLAMASLRSCFMA